MTYGENGSVIGPQNLPTASAAPGVWSLGEIAESVRDGIWPAPDAITMMGFFRPDTSVFGTGTYGSVVLDTDSSGNLFAMFPAQSSGNNYIVEVNKTTKAINSIRNYTQAGSAALYLSVMGISKSTDVMYLGGRAATGPGSNVPTQMAGITQSGSTGYDTFSTWDPGGISVAGFADGSMGGSPFTYNNYYFSGADKNQRLAIDDTNGVVYAGGKWWISNSYGRLLALDAGTSYANRGYCFWGSAYGSYSSYVVSVLGSKSPTSGRAYALVMDDGNPNKHVSLQQIIRSTNTDSDGDRGASGRGNMERDIWRKQGRVMACCDSMTLAPDTTEIIYIASADPGTSQVFYLTKVNNSSGLTYEWTKQITTPWANAYPNSSGPVVSAAGDVYCAWYVPGGSASNSGGIYVGKWDSSGNQQWLNLLEFNDANQTDNNHTFYSCDIKLGTTDSADDSLWISSGQMYWGSGTTGYADEKMICRVRTDGLGLGTYNFSMTGKQGGALSISYTASGLTTSAYSSSSASANPPTTNFGSSYGYQNTQSTTNAQVTSGTTWETNP